MASLDKENEDWKNKKGTTPLNAFGIFARYMEGVMSYFQSPLENLFFFSCLNFQGGEVDAICALRDEIRYWLEKVISTKFSLMSYFPPNAKSNGMVN